MSLFLFYSFILFLWLSCCSVTKSCLTLCNPRDYSTPGFSVLHCLPEFAQIDVRELLMLSNHLILYCPLLLLAFSLSQHQGLFQWIGFLHQVAKSIGASASASVLPVNIQAWFPLGLTGLILVVQGLSKVFSSTTIQKYQFFDAQPVLWSNSHIHTWLLEKP